MIDLQQKQKHKTVEVLKHNKFTLHKFTMLQM